TPILSPPRKPHETNVPTFLFTDIEGSARRWETDAAAMRLDLAQHDQIVREALERRGGKVFKTVGDAFLATFEEAPNAVAAAIDLQHGLTAADWQGGAPPAVRVAAHTGEAESRDGDFFGPSLNKVARLLSAGHGGQILVTLVTAELVRDSLPEAVELVDLGVHRFRDLQRAEPIFMIKAPGLPSVFPRLRSVETARSNLPMELTTFVGRSAEIGELRGLLDHGRLVSVTGAGGAGKSRLALRTAAEILDDFPDGVWLIELAPISDRDGLPAAIVAAIGLPETPGRSAADALEEFVRPRSLLLIVDNCEHVLAAVAELADRLLHASAGLKILATSREALGIAGEVTYRVPSLSLPSEDASVPLEDVLATESVRLFIDRARAVQPGFSPTGADRDALVMITRRLDGIALAIELAAARVRLMAPEEIGRRLDDRFRLLTGGSRTALPRQQTLRALIDWSYDLLSEAEQTLFRRLAVFAGGWTLEAAEAVGGAAPLEPLEVLDLLAHLVDKSLATTEEASAENRYRLLETVRQYARDRLLESGDGTDARERHARWYLALAIRADAEIHGPMQIGWLVRMDAERPNLLAAAAWLRETNPEAGLELVAALNWYWHFRGRWEEGAEVAGAALAASGKLRSRAYLGALQAHASLVGRRIQSAEGSEELEEALALSRELGDDRALGITLWGSAMIAWAAGRFDDMDDAVREADRAFTNASDPWGMSLAALLRSQAKLARGDVIAARPIVEEAVERMRAVGDKWLLSQALGVLSSILTYVGEMDGARRASEEGLAYLRKLGDPASIGASLRGATWDSIYRGDLETAQEYAEESVSFTRLLGSEGELAGSYWVLGAVEVKMGRLHEAAEHLAHAEEVFRRNASLAPLANTLDAIGELALANRDADRAAAAYMENLEIRTGQGDRRGIGHSLTGLAAAAQARGEDEEAARLLGRAGRIWEELHVTLPPSDQARTDELIASSRGAIGADAFEQAWQAGWTMDGTSS
ncbi:MAG: adenylate/guanylate cyclase domain-containing protein, partial [Candidatus Limnocylindrales bacterium]